MKKPREGGGDKTKTYKRAHRHRHAPTYLAIYTWAGINEPVTRHRYTSKGVKKNQTRHRGRRTAPHGQWGHERHTVARAIRAAVLRSDVEALVACLALLNRPGQTGFAVRHTAGGVGVALATCNKVALAACRAGVRAGVHARVAIGYTAVHGHRLLCPQAKQQKQHRHHCHRRRIPPSLLLRNCHFQQTVNSGRPTTAMILIENQNTRSVRSPGRLRCWCRRTVSLSLFCLSYYYPKL